MNLIPGTVRAANGGQSVETADGVALPLPPGAPAHNGRPVLYGVRPDHLSVAGNGGFDVTVDVVEPTGADTLVFARAGGQKICGAFAERHSFKPGERITLAPRLDCVHLFDAQSGLNLMQ
jgi:multiple sugar transport system ATP-binding protein